MEVNALQEMINILYFERSMFLIFKPKCHNNAVKVS